MPDIDIDFDQEQREIVIEYVLKKYGSQHVAHMNNLWYTEGEGCNKRCWKGS